MSLPIAWVDKLFEKLAIRYGRDFLGRWEGMPIADIKTDWSDVLSGFKGHPDSIAWALDNLPEVKAPTSTEFRALCRPSDPVNLKALSVDLYPLVNNCHTSAAKFSDTGCQLHGTAFTQRINRRSPSAPELFQYQLVLAHIELPFVSRACLARDASGFGSIVIEPG